MQTKRLFLAIKINPDDNFKSIYNGLKTNLRNQNIENGFDQIAFGIKFDGVQHIFVGATVVTNQTIVGGKGADGSLAGNAK